MEPPSAPPRGGRVPWQELLLAVSLLTIWNPPTTAQVTVESVPPNVAVGKNVLLSVHNRPGDPIGYGWFRGPTTEPSLQIVSYAVNTQNSTAGPAHSGRETIYPNGSLLFQNITLNDTGYYTVQIIKKNFQVVQGRGQLRVIPELPKPSITSNNSDPVENVDSVVISCGPQTQSTSYLWSVNNESLPASARLELSLDNRTLTIHGVTRNDTGPYECETRNPVSAGRSDPFTLNVLYERSTTGLPVGSIIGIAVGVLVGLALSAALGCLLLHTRTGRASGCRDLRELWRPASTPRHGPASSSASPDSLPSPTTAISIYQVQETREQEGQGIAGGRRGRGQTPATQPGSQRAAQVVLELESHPDMFQEDDRGSEASSSFTGITTPRHKHLLPDQPQSRNGFLVSPGNCSFQGPPETPDSRWSQELQPEPENRLSPLKIFRDMDPGSGPN